jgi:hypothetical protein
MRGESTRDGTEAQLHTLEGLAASILVVLGLVFASQAVAVTSTSSTTSSEDIEAQYDQLAQDLLTQAKSSGALQDAVLNWNENERRFVGTEDLYYYQGESPPGRFGRTLDRVVMGNNLAYNVELVYQSEGSTLSVPLVDNGEPSANSVTANEVIVLNENDRLAEGTLLTDSTSYPMDNMDNEAMYNIVNVRLTVWRR